MLKLSVKGLNDGNYDIDVSYPSKEAENLAEEFFGDIRVTGKLVKIKDRYNFDGMVECNAKFKCDRSLNEFTERIKCDMKWTCIRDTEQFQKDSEEGNDPGMLSIHNDSHEIDITEETVEQLFVAIPMKKISPEFRDKDITDLYPEHSVSEEEQKVDSRWSKLKDIKFN